MLLYVLSSLSLLSEFFPPGTCSTRSVSQSSKVMADNDETDCNPRDCVDANFGDEDSEDNHGDDDGDGNHGDDGGDSSHGSNGDTYSGNGDSNHDDDNGDTERVGDSNIPIKDGRLCGMDLKCIESFADNCQSQPDPLSDEGTGEDYVDVEVIDNKELEGESSSFEGENPMQNRCQDVCCLHDAVAMACDNKKMADSEANLTNGDTNMPSSVVYVVSDSKKACTGDANSDKCDFKKNDFDEDANTEGTLVVKEGVVDCADNLTELIVLDIGGYVYKTTSNTLAVDDKSLLYTLVTDNPRFPRQIDGSFFIDRDGQYFYVILDYLRKGTLALESVLLKPYPGKYEAVASLHSDGKFFNLTEFSDNLAVTIFTSITILNSPEEYRLQNVLRMQVLDLGDETECFQISEEPDSTPSILSQIPHDYNILSHFDSRAKLKKIAFAQFSWTNLSIRYHRSTVPPSDCEKLFTRRFNEHEYTDSSGKEVVDTFYYCTLVNIHFRDHFSADFCNLSGVLFRNCYFEKGADFTGSIMRGTRFTACYGLVKNGVVFSPIQAKEAVFDKELFEALKDHGCIRW